MNQNVKQFGCRSGSTFCWSDLIWVQTVVKGYRQTIQVAVSKERKESSKNFKKLQV